MRADGLRQSDRVNLTFESGPRGLKTCVHERAATAADLLDNGATILDAVERGGYADQVGEMYAGMNLKIDY